MSAAPTAFAAATVRSSIDAAMASGVVPGMKFATVSPIPPSMNARREIFDLVMALSLDVLFYNGHGGAYDGHCTRRAAPPPIAAEHDCCLFDDAECEPRLTSPRAEEQAGARDGVCERNDNRSSRVLVAVSRGYSAYSNQAHPSVYRKAHPHYRPRLLPS